MKTLSKILSTFFVFSILLSCLVIPAAADVKANSAIGESNIAVGGYDLDELGQFFAEAKVPEGFDELIYLVFMDSYSATQTFLLDPRNDYTYRGEAVSGLYYISGYVVNDYDFDYLVTRSEDTVVISDDRDVYITLTVTGGQEDNKEELDESVPGSEPEDTPITSPDTELPVITPDTELPDESSTEKDIPEQNGESGNNDEAEEERDHSKLKNALVILIGSACFVGLVFLAVFVYRRFFIN